MIGVSIVPVRAARLRVLATRSVLVACFAIPTSGCSRSSDRLATPSAATTTVTVATSGTGPGSSDPQLVTAGTAATNDGFSSTPANVSPTTPSTEMPTALTVGSVVTVNELPEVGVPGLDSADVFCSSWSRFAGSFQVVAVTAAFGSGPPEQLASLEVAASPVVTQAYDDLLANWPDELSSEAELVADDFLGPFARRLRTARESLMGAGADPDATEAISDAWLAGLAGRDPTTPEFTVDMTDESWEVIDAAAADFASRLVPFADDPSLISDVSIPLTDAYLAASCPDQGTLSGQEVDAG